MKNRVTMIDHKNHRFIRNSRFLPWLIVGVMFSIGAVSMLAQSAKAENVQCSIVGAEFDNLMSEDAAAFMATHPGEYTEYDLD